MSATWRIHAIKYGAHERRASANFLGGDEHDGPMPIDFFVWALTSGGRTIVVDTGFGPDAAARRQRTIDRPVEAGLRAIGIEPSAVEDVVVTHMHYDHAGNAGLFPRATFHLQDREMAYCTGRCMCEPSLRFPFDVEDVQTMVAKVFDGRVRFHDGDGEVAPGVTVHRVGGHTQGLQVVRVATGRGAVVLASDASHHYANLEQRRPFPIVVDVAAMLAGYDTVLRLADSPRHWIPGHDPQVLARYPAAGPGLEGWIARLDLPPR